MLGIPTADQIKAMADAELQQFLDDVKIALAQANLDATARITQLMDRMDGIVSRLDGATMTFKLGTEK